MTRVEGVKECDQDDLEKVQMTAEEGDQTQSRLITRSMASTYSSTTCHCQDECIFLHSQLLEYLVTQAVPVNAWVLDVDHWWSVFTR